MLRTNWEKNAEKVRNIYGGFVDYDEGFYICPECDEPVYIDDWSSDELGETMCPICYFDENEK